MARVATPQIVEAEMIFYAILCYAILFYSMLFYSMLFYAILFYSHASDRRGACTSTRGGRRTPNPNPGPSPRPQAVLLDLRRESLVDSTLFDIRGLVIDILTNDPKLAVDTMIEMGRRTLQPTHTSARPHLDLGFSSVRRDLDAISTQSRGHLEVISRSSRGRLG